jgi:D-xylose transport system permease protein
VLSGIPVGKVVVTAYTLLGGLVALTGLLQTAYAGASTTTVGELMELDAVAACVIGGCSLRGGRGSVAGVLLGSLVMASLLSGMSLLAVPPEARFIARGLVLGLAAWLDVRLSKMSRGSLA